MWALHHLQIESEFKPLCGHTPRHMPIYELLITISFLIFVVNSIALVKPEKAKMMEGMLIQMARSGQIAGKVTTAFDYS